MLDARRDHFVRRLAALDPASHDAEQVERVGARSAIAFNHPRHHVEANRAPRVLAADPGLNAVVVVQDGSGRHEGVVPAARENQLPAAPHVFRDVGVRRVDARDVRPIGQRDMAVEIDRARPIVPGRILENRVAQRARRNADRAGRFDEETPVQLAAAIERRPDLLVRPGIGRSGVDLLNGFDLRRRQAVRSVTGLCTRSPSGRTCSGSDSRAVRPSPRRAGRTWPGRHRE